MKNKHFCLTFVLGCMCLNLLAQWNQTAPSGFKFGQTDRIGLLPANWIKSIGVGNFTAFNDQPRAALHVNQFYLFASTGFGASEVFRTDCNQTSSSAWRMFTGPNAAGSLERFALFVPANTSDVFQQSSRGDLYFSTFGPNTGVQTRMQITNAIGNSFGVQQPNATRVNINYGAGYPTITTPVAAMNIGFQPANLGGQRNWMDVGTFTCANTDNMYVGLKNVTPGGGFGQGTDQMDAVINWGDNDVLPGFGPDNMRFIFTGAQNVITPTGASSNEGLEVMRMTPINNLLVFTGVGGDPLINLYSTGVNPGAIFEVNSPGATNFAGGSSGLRFTNLTTASPTIANPGTGLLAVNAAGDVVYVQQPPSVPFGGICGNTNSMTSDWENPMAGFNYVFTGQSANGHRVGIGLPAGGCAPNAKLDVRMASGVANAISISTATNDLDGVAIKAQTIGLSSGQQTKVAGWFESTNVNGGQQVAIYVPQNKGCVNIGYPTTNSGLGGLLHVNGSIYMNGQLVQTSDASIKTNVATLQNSYSVISRLRPVSYNYTSSAITDSTMLGLHFGLIAQEVDTVLSEIVHESDAGLKSVSYTEIIPYLIGALQSEHNRNDSLAAALNNLTAVVNGCCASASRNSNQNTTDVHLSNENGIVLNQNIPNPFAEQTTISYFLPESVVRAQILFYDATGKLIKAVDLDERGNGQLNVFADDLSNGIYSYALVADGNIMDTKRMVKAK